MFAACCTIEKKLNDDVISMKGHRKQLLMGRGAIVLKTIEKNTSNYSLDVYKSRRFKNVLVIK